ncbi:hypothetical protein F8388_007300 [Cannabis sativa]|uniref:Uncharacterized protein n=1 Tax=Cannabis sativa TaxID=3483 RepID=A0A7J6FJU6_CANSA|nr:hypothetical protein F8388_007300 [Cannabis sativa]
MVENEKFSVLERPLTKSFEAVEKLLNWNKDGIGRLKVWLDKTTGGVCLSVASKGLSITRIDDRRYWKYIPTEESR